MKKSTNLFFAGILYGLSCAWYFLSVGHLFAQNSLFGHYGQNSEESKGLPEPFVNALAQDKEGLLWVATGGGAASFDGISFKHYKKSSGLDDTFVTFIFCDDKNGVWIGNSSGGIALLDRKTGRFKKIIKPDGFKDKINRIFQTNKGILAVSQSGGFCLLSLDGSIITVFQPKDSGLVYWMEEVGDEIWLATQRGIKKAKVDWVAKKIQLADGPAELQNVRVTHLAVYREKNGFAGTLASTFGKGVFWISKNGGTSHKLEVTGGGSPSFPNQCLFDSEGGLKIADNREGIFEITSFKPGQTVYEARNYKAYNSLLTDNAKCLLYDREGNLWVGAGGEGLFKFNGDAFFIPKMPFGGKNALAVLIDAEGRFWAGYENGLFVGDERFLPVPGIDTLLFKGVSVSSLAESDNGDIWVGTGGKGLWIFAKSSGKFRKAGLVDGYEGVLVNHIARDQTGAMWVATTLDGVYKFEKNKNGFSKAMQFSTKQGFIHNDIKHVFPDSKGRVWLSAHGTGLAFYKEGGLTVMNGEDAIGPSNINCVAEDIDKNIWIGTDGDGVFKYDGKTFIGQGTETGMLSDYARLVAIDPLGDVWVGAQQGINRLRKHTGNVEAVTSVNGALEAKTNRNACFYDKKHNALWFGTENGFFAYYPDKDRFNYEPPVTAINGFYVSDSLTEMLEGLELPYRRHKIAFSYRGVSLKDPEKTMYKYFLEGYDSGWSVPTPERTVMYRRIDYGDYVFKVMASNNDGVWNTEPTTYAFSVKKPIWLKWWFYALVLTLAIFAGYTVYRFRLKKLVEQKIALEQKVAERTAQLIEKTEKLETANLDLADKKALIEQAYAKLKTLEEFKDSMTAMIVHDLKNPLNSIIGLSEQNSVKKAGRKMLDLVTNILDVQKLESAEMKINPKEVWGSEIAFEAISQATPLAFDKKIKLSTDFSDDVLIMAEKGLIVRVLENLLTNAIKFSPENSSVVVFAEVLAGEKNMRMGVRDSGQGIPADQLLRVFDKYYQAKAMPSGLASSTGLGLTFCKMAIELHGGIIMAKSEVGYGSEFSFELPLLTAKNHISTDNPSLYDNITEQQEKHFFEGVDVSSPYFHATVRVFSSLEYFETSTAIEALSRIPEGELVVWKKEMSEALWAFDENRFGKLKKALLENHLE